jgi:hypothetical protein
MKAQAGSSGAADGRSDCTREIDDWATCFSLSWCKAVEAAIEVGRLLIVAKEALPLDDFGEMVWARMPFGANRAKWLMAMVADPQLINPANVQHLPPAWGTLPAERSG